MRWPMNLLQEYWQIFAGALAGIVWSLRLEGKVSGIDRKEREDPAIRKAFFELYAKAERENVTLRLDLLAHDIGALRDTVNTHHEEVIDRIDKLSIEAKKG